MQLRGAQYDAVIDEFVRAVISEFPGRCCSGKTSARKTRRHWNVTARSCRRNDDIQGTAPSRWWACSLGLYQRARTADERIVVFGAGAGDSASRGRSAPDTRNRIRRRADPCAHCSARQA
jgi:malic enzyme